MVQHQDVYYQNYSNRIVVNVYQLLLELFKYKIKKYSEKMKFYYKVNNEQDQDLIPNNNHIMHEIYQEYEQDHHEKLN